MYMDPGFGSMIIQLIVATIAASGAMLAIFRKKVFGFFKKNKENPVQDAEINDKSESAE